MNIIERCTRCRRGVLRHCTPSTLSSAQEQRKKKANDLKNSSTAKQKEKDDVRKLLDKKPKKAKRKKPTLEKAPLGALKTTDKKSELAPIGATSPVVAKKEPTRTGDDHLSKIEPKRTGGDDADRPTPVPPAAPLVRLPTNCPLPKAIVWPQKTRASSATAQHRRPGT